MATLSHPQTVMAVLDTAIHSVTPPRDQPSIGPLCRTDMAWMAVSSTAMTSFCYWPPALAIDFAQPYSRGLLPG
jgi:hypothetical protein